MTETATRYTTETVTFSQAFTLGASAEVYPAGTYEVETAEEPTDVSSHIVHLRTATVLIIPTRAGTVHRKISASELNEALEREHADEDPNPKDIMMTAKADSTVDAELSRLGIERVLTETFLWGDYRYSSAHDAIAAAKRETKR